MATCTPVRTDGALYDYVAALKTQYMRNADPLSKVMYDNKLHIVRHALGTHDRRVAGAGRQAQGQARDPHCPASSGKPRRPSCG